MNDSKPENRPGAEPESTPTERVDGGDATKLAEALEQYMAELEAGRAPDRAALVARHPELASQLEQALSGIDFIHKTTRQSGGAPAQLGDFRIVREVGRGGMGVVYEAEQISLKRRVALKVLRLGGWADELAMQRFQREAEMIARLHHTSIVPIFAVGCAEDVRYYAMQFIDGRNLAGVIEESRGKGQTIGAREAANWGLQAAEALAHAHQRGVIHRDIKPSNLILDNEGRIWLTDFGLARRIDDLSLSVTGALLGTPRYMSPEQANSAAQPVDHRTDIYSLGATLYELVTGKPIFEAKSPHEIITQILRDEPPSVRIAAPGVPRDLETIIAKCLAKQPAQRYGNAALLAEDLRAFMEGRPISARPPTVAERVARWSRKHRGSTRVAAVSALISLALLICGFMAWQRHQKSLLGTLSLSTSGPNLLAEVLDSQDRVVGPTIPVPTSRPVELPAGPYRLRISASGLMSETWPIDLERGKLLSHEVALHPSWLWQPMDVNTAEYPETDVAVLGARADLIVRGGALGPAGEDLGKRLRRMDGATGKPVWEKDLLFNESTLPEPGFLQDWEYLVTGSGVSEASDSILADPAADLDGDGVKDIVLTSRRSPSIAAVSGASGKPLWWFRFKTPFRTREEAKGWKVNSWGYGGSIVGKVAVADVDGDGVPDYVACLGSRSETFTNQKGESKNGASSAWVVAVSGKNGEEVWRHSMGDAWQGYANSSESARKFNRLCRPGLASVGGKAVVVLADETRLFSFDAKTGEEAWSPKVLGFEPMRAPDLADLDGDGQTDALFVHRAKHYQDCMGMVAISLSTLSEMWRTETHKVLNYENTQQSESFGDLYAITDLDRDGRKQVCLWQVTHGKEERGFGLANLQVLEGSNGKPRWERTLWHEPQSWYGNFQPQLLIGPDLDGDGKAELVAAWIGPDARAGQSAPQVAALSGADGRVFWRTGIEAFRLAGRMQWWCPGPDAQPQLLVPVGDGPGRKPGQHILEGSTGRIVETLPDVRKSVVADFDGDGIPDLFYTVYPQGLPRQFVMKGQAPDTWRRLGNWAATGDLDGDGRSDFIEEAPGGWTERISARSGRDGSLLWSSRKKNNSSSNCPLLLLPPGGGDLNGDGIPDLLAPVQAWKFRPNGGRVDFHPLRAFSGKDGSMIWTSDGLEQTSGSSSSSGSGANFDIPNLFAEEIEGDGVPDILATDLRTNGLPVLRACSGKSGRLLWSLPLIQGGYAPTPSPQERHFFDLNGDGAGDIVLWAPDSEGSLAPAHLMAFSGRTGQPIWTNSPLRLEDLNKVTWPEPSVAAWEGEGTANVAVSLNQGYNNAVGSYRFELVGLDGRAGREVWRWPWSGRNANLPPPIILKPRPDRPSVVCLAIYEGETNNLVVLSNTGKFLRRIGGAVPGINVGGSGHSVWRVADLDGDGGQHLLVTRGGKLCAYGGSAMDLRWEWTLPFNSTRLVEVSPRTAERPPQLVVWCGGSVYGLDAPTGRKLWRCEVGEAPGWGGLRDTRIRLATSSEHPGLPSVQTFRGPNYGGWVATVCRQALPVTPTGQLASLPARPKQYQPVPEPAVSGRKLPWLNGDETIILTLGLHSLLLLLIPVWLAAWAARCGTLKALRAPGLYLFVFTLMVPQFVTPLIGLALAGRALAAAAKKRSWGWAVAGAALGLSAVLPVALALVKMRQLPDPDLPPSVWHNGVSVGVSLMAILGMPPWFFYRRVFREARLGRWRAVRGWLLASLLLTVPVAWAMLLKDSGDKSPQESYSWIGLPAVWLCGAYVAGIGAAVAEAKQFLARRNKASVTVPEPTLAEPPVSNA